MALGRIFAWVAAGYLMVAPDGPAVAQNLIVDGGFDGATNTNVGNNHAESLPVWRFATLTPQQSLAVVNAHNLVRVDGPGGYDYVDFTGTELGPESDALGTGTAQFYVDSGAIPTFAWQYFTPSCDGVADAEIYASNREAHGMSGGHLFGGAVPTALNGGLYPTEGALSVVPVNTELPEFVNGVQQLSGAQEQTFLDLITAHRAGRYRFALAAAPTRNYPWVSIATQVPVQAGQTYAYVAEFSHSVNIDNAAVAVQCGAVLPEIDAQNVILDKQCEPPLDFAMNGTLGQVWTCRVEVTVPTAPFAGDLVIQDVFTPNALSSGQIIRAEWPSGNGVCTLADCTISGGDFDVSGTEVVEFDVFVEATEPADVYPLENCATATLTSGTNATPVAPSCTSAQWIPRAEVTKSCDPIPANSSAPFTMNCQIDVVASGLTTTGFVTVMDAFVAQPPAQATVFPTFMNVTSTENWTCIDQQLNQPSSIGICELPAGDLMAAGGTSTLHTSFLFDVDQAPTQVANCRFVDLHPESFLDQLSGQRGALRSPVAGGWPQMPDGCVYVDVPGVQLETKVDPKVTKNCDQPMLTQLGGVDGYLWQCEAEINVTPSPFAGTFSFVDDASQISLGTAEFVSVSDPNNCQGIGTGQLNCTYAGGTLSAPHYVQYDLFAPYVPTQDVITWKNCIDGHAETPAGVFAAVPMCVERSIKPLDKPILPTAKDISVKKSCGRGYDTEHDGETGLGWQCEITVTATPAPFAGTFTFHENASNITGSTGQIIAIDQQNPPSWACLPGLPTPATHCTIQGADFDPTGTETVGFTLFAPTGDQPIAWENCADGVYTPLDGEPREIKGNCQDLTWKPDVSSQGDPAVDVKKECKPLGERMIMSDTAWFQQIECTLTVTSNGVPFAAPLWVNENMLYGANNGGASVVSIGSVDPWQCVPAPYGPGGNQPVCGIDPTQFPYGAGQSTLTVVLNLFGGAADQFGAQNCAALTMGPAPSIDPADFVAQSCVELAAPPPLVTPSIDLVKTCEPAVLGANNQWSVACVLTITGQNLPAGEPVRVMDELMSSATQTAVFGQMTAPTNACGGGLINGGAATGCDISTDDIINAGGTLTIPYSGTYQGPAGRPISGPQAQNCAYVDVPGVNLHGPTGGNGKSCVPVEFKLAAVTGPGIDPTIGTGPIIGTPGSAGALDGISLPDPTAVPTLEKTCAPLVFAAGQNKTQASCDITVTVPTGTQIEMGRLIDAARVPNTDYNIAGVVNPTITGLANLGCVEGSNGYDIPITFCTGPAIADFANGGQFDLQWSAQMGTANMIDADYRNCAYLSYRATPGGPIQNLQACHKFEVIRETRAPTPPVVEASLAVTKRQTADCVANRNTQRYTCGFRLSVTNTGTAPFHGPLVVTDTFGSPGAQEITLLSGGGWSCAQPVAGAISCEHAGLALAPGAFAPIDLSMEVQGLVNGGTFNNCAAVGIPHNRAQRVAAMQQIMNARGLNAGPVDGKPGKRTYGALAELQRSLGVPVSREINDGLLRALGVPLQKPGLQSCVNVPLPPMPKPPLQCDRATTVQKGEACQCRFDNMVRRNAVSCQCQAGDVFVPGKGCEHAVVVDPTPPPLEEPLVCDRNTTRPRDGQCVCLDPKNAVKTSSSACGCKNGLPMVNGRCLPIVVAPKPVPGTDDAAGENRPCKINVNGVCLKY